MIKTIHIPKIEKLNITKVSQLDWHQLHTTTLCIHETLFARGIEVPPSGYDTVILKRHISNFDRNQMSIRTTIKTTFIEEGWL